MVLKRAHFALLSQSFAAGGAPELKDVHKFADLVVGYARTIGLPEGNVTKGSSLNYLRLDGLRRLDR